MACLTEEEGRPLGTVRSGRVPNRRQLRGPHSPGGERDGKGPARRGQVRAPGDEHPGTVVDVSKEQGCLPKLGVRLTEDESCLAETD